MNDDDLDDGEDQDDELEQLEPIGPARRIRRIRRRAEDARRWRWGVSTDPRSRAEFAREEEARLRQPWRCANRDGRQRAGRSELCVDCLAAHRRGLAARRAIAFRRRHRAVAS